MDKNNSGYLTSFEIKESWSEEGVDLSSQTISSIIKAFDLNNDKVVSLEGKSH